MNSCPVQSLSKNTKYANESNSIKTYLHCELISLIGSPDWIVSSETFEILSNSTLCGYYSSKFRWHFLNFICYNNNNTKLDETTVSFTSFCFLLVQFLIKINLLKNYQIPIQILFRNSLILPHFLIYQLALRRRWL